MASEFLKPSNNGLRQPTDPQKENGQIINPPRFAEMGGVPGGGTPAEFGAFMDREQASWRKIVEAAKLSME
jgi:hypothetical protein